MQYSKVFPFRNRRSFQINQLFTSSTFFQFTEWCNTYLSSNQTNRLIKVKNEIQNITSTKISYDPTKRQKLLRNLSRMTGGINFAMSIRKDILDYIRFEKHKEDPNTINFIKTSEKLFENWLTAALCNDSLQLKRITFDDSSGQILEKVARFEAVHSVRSLSELKRRLQNGRRCYALFHPSLQSEPLAFVHIALTKEITTSISIYRQAGDIYRQIHEVQELSQPKCAIFYSLNSPHPGLSGLDMASNMIDRASAALRSDFTTIDTLCTLSPIPGFLQWMSPSRLRKASGFFPDISSQSLHAIYDKYRHQLWTGDLSSIEFISNAGEGDNGDRVTDLKHEDSSKDVIFREFLWVHEVVQLFLRVDVLTAGPVATECRDVLRNDVSVAGVVEELKHVLLWLCAYYLVREKRGNNASTSESNYAPDLPLDPVARFHLRNGATLLQINWMANPSQAGLSSSIGIMANYQYDIDSSRNEDKSEEFISSGGNIPFEDSIKDILEGRIHNSFN